LIFVLCLVIGKPKYVVDPSVKGNNTYGSYNNGLENPVGQQSGFNTQMRQPHTVNQPFIQQSGFNSSMVQPQPHIFNQPFGQQSGFNPPMGQSNFINQPLGPNEQLNQKIRPNINDPATAQISNFNQHKHVDQLPNLNPQPTFQPIQSHLSNFSQAIPQSPNFNQSSLTYNQRAPSGKLIFI